ncbi:hypothetical protein ACFQX8_16045 [Klenkia terrae]|uniref:phosphorylase family protein n=1 Tax=Klenkia terrae TaxID=1052259 RepID=UPI003614EC02
MGSGWAPAADAFGEILASVGIGELPGFAAPTVQGHGGEIRSVVVGDHRVLLFLGRTHLYEGRGVEPVVHGIRTAAAAGVRTVLLTNAAGGLSPQHAVGQAVLISDHLNLTARSPLVGARFVDLTDLYSPGCASWPARSTRPWSRASTPPSRARTSRPPPRSAC